MGEWWWWCLYGRLYHTYALYNFMGDSNDSGLTLSAAHLTHAPGATRGRVRIGEIFTIFTGLAVVDAVVVARVDAIVALELAGWAATGDRGGGRGGVKERVKAMKTGLGKGGQVSYQVVHSVFVLKPS